MSVLNADDEAVDAADEQLALLCSASISSRGWTITDGGLET